MTSGVPYILPIVFAIALIVTLLIYYAGGRLAPKSSQSIGKNAAYNCGEAGSPKEAKLDLERFLTYAIYFLIFDVVAFVTMTSYYATDYLPVVYSLVVLASVGMLVFARKTL
jgi:NADH:ubiquinone oxidoreductase subunit 3 (subunit A)